MDGDSSALTTLVTHVYSSTASPQSGVGSTLSARRDCRPLRQSHRSAVVTLATNRNPRCISSPQVTILYCCFSSRLRSFSMNATKFFRFMLSQHTVEAWISSTYQCQPCPGQLQRPFYVVHRRARRQLVGPCAGVAKLQPRVRREQVGGDGCGWLKRGIGTVGVGKEKLWQEETPVPGIHRKRCLSLPRTSRRSN